MARLSSHIFTLSMQMRKGSFSVGKSPEGAVDDEKGSSCADPQIKQGLSRAEHTAGLRPSLLPFLCCAYGYIAGAGLIMLFQLIGKQRMGNAQNRRRFAQGAVLRHVLIDDLDLVFRHQFFQCFGLRLCLSCHSYQWHFLQGCRRCYSQIELEVTQNT